MSWLWLKLTFPIIIIVAPLALGYWLGKRFKTEADNADSSPLGAVVNAGLGLLAFMLAFTFQITATRFQTRKGLVLEEAIAIKEVYRNAGLLKDSNTVICRGLIKEYLDLRVHISTHFKEINTIKGRSKRIQDSLWMQAEALAREDRSSEIYSLFTASLNNLISIHNQRAVIALQYRIPKAIMLILYFISFFSMLTLGFQFGISIKSNIKISAALVIVFGAVMWLIFALDNPEIGLVKINQQPIIDVREELQNTP